MADTTALAGSHSKTYKGTISPYQSLYLSNQGSITTVAVVSQHSGHPQNTLPFETGEWTAAPLMYPLANNLVIVIVITGTIHTFFQVQGNQIQMHRQLNNADVLAQLKVASLQALQPTEGIPSPPPPRPKPNLNISQKSDQPPPDSPTNVTTFPSTGSPRKPQTVRRFCTQCGSAIDQNDRFCAYCGHDLVSANSAIA